MMSQVYVVLLYQSIMYHLISMHEVSAIIFSMSVQDIGLNHEGKLKTKTPVELFLVWTAWPVLML